MIYSEILSKYHFPHSVSIIGAEVEPTGLYPKLSPRLMEIARKFYSLENVEPATHTFTHPFTWGKIKNDTLAPEYRLQPKGYHFSLQNELEKPLKFIANNLQKYPPKHKAQTVFWSGDCSPRVNALEFAYKHKILNINGGYTTISNTQPWVTLVSPLGLQRDGYYQVYTGAQNENVYTNDWLGPFWGFKKVVQTFKMTDKPRRLKPIDVYYHLYSGSKVASLNALRYIFDWVLTQEITPLYASEYIPKVMDFYAISIAQDGDNYEVAGLKDLKTLRVSKEKNYTYEKKSHILGEKVVAKDKYIHVTQAQNVYLYATSHKPNTTYVIDTNGYKLSTVEGVNSKRYHVQSHVDLSFHLHLQNQGCRIVSQPNYTQRKDINSQEVMLEYKNKKEAQIDVICQ
jgi:hypothetical protein